MGASNVMHTIQKSGIALLHMLGCKLVVGALNGNPTIGKSCIHFLHMKLVAFGGAFNGMNTIQNRPMDIPQLKTTYSDT